MLRILILLYLLIGITLTLARLGYSRIDGWSWRKMRVNLKRLSYHDLPTALYMAIYYPFLR